MLTYSENDAVFDLPLGLESPEITELEFGKNRFLVAVKAAFKTDEEDRRVLVVRIDFMEFPSSRVLKFIFIDEHTVLLRQTEFPGKEFAIETIRETMGDFSDKPMLARIMERVGTDFFEFKAERAFSPELILKETQKTK